MIIRRLIRRPICMAFSLTLPVITPTVYSLCLNSSCQSLTGYFVVLLSRHLGFSSTFVPKLGLFMRCCQFASTVLCVLIAKQVERCCVVTIVSMISRFVEMTPLTLTNEVINHANVAVQTIHNAAGSRQQ